jgi:hypothetical protein
MITADEWNERNARFWLVKNKETEERMIDRPVLEAALARLLSDSKRFLPAKYQIDFGPALAEAEQQKRHFARHFARHGGKAKKTDLLQQRILAAVRKKPDTKAPELLEMLRNEAQLGGPIVEITKKYISFDIGDGRLRNAAISGLKDRLSRAKKELKSKI